MIKSFVVLGLKLWWSEEDEGFLYLTSRGSKVKKREFKVILRNVKTVDESISGAFHCDFGGAVLASELASAPLHIQPTQSGPSVLSHYYTWKHYR
jgi:hypothetical protein